MNKVKIKFILKVWMVFYFMIHVNIVWATVNKALINLQNVPKYMPKEVIVKLQKSKFKDKIEIASYFNQIFNDVNLKYSLKEIKVLFQFQNVEKKISGNLQSAFKDLERVYRLKFEDNVDVFQIIQKLNKHPDVEYAEPNYIAHICIIPDDSLFSQQWYLHNTGQYFLEDADIDAPEAWNVETGDESIIVAIIDTGIDYLHPDLMGNIFSYGYDFVNNDADAMDDNGHGTHVAGIVAAVSNNQKGITGVSWRAKILPVKVLNSKGWGSYADIADGVLYAVQQGARVINLSLGGYAESYLLKDALETAYSQAIIVAAAGNDGLEYDDFGSPFYPAAWEFVLGVGATDVLQTPYGYQEAKALFSNFGMNTDVYAPGVNILSTFPYFHPLRHGYRSLNGTSMAAPIVSGVVSLLKSKYPDWSNEMIRGQIIHTSDRIDYGGRINAYQALTEVSQPKLSIYTVAVIDTLPGGDRDRIADAGETIQLIVEIDNTWKTALNVSLVLKPNSSEDVPFIEILDSTANVGNLSAYARTNNENDPFLVRIKNNVANNQDIYFNCEMYSDGGYKFSEVFHLRIQKGIEVGGILSSNTVWSNKYFYIIKSNVLVPQEVRLIIEPGTEVRFEKDTYLRIDGELIAIGTKDSLIVFTSNAPSPYPGIYQGIRFTDSAVDAQFDDSGNYVSGSTIQYADISWGEVGLSVNRSSPYLSNNFIHDNQKIGLDVYFSNSVIEDNIIQNNGNEHWGYAAVQLTFSGIFRRNLIQDNIGYSGFSAIYIYGGDGKIEYNIIRGNQYNNIEGGSALYIQGSDVIIRNNLIYLNKNKEKTGVISFTDYDKSIFEYNTVTNNEGGILIRNDSKPQIHYNNLLRNHADHSLYEIKLTTSDEPIIASNNFWGTTKNDSIEKWIWDYYDDFDLGVVYYVPFLNEPVTQAPGFLYNVDVMPASPIGTGKVQFDLTFSSPMDIEIQPKVTFGVTEPYTQHEVYGNWIDSLHWRGTFDVDFWTGDGINYLRVSKAQDENGLEISKENWFSFVINAMWSASVDFTAIANDGFVELEWRASHSRNLLGYNLYRFKQINDTTFSDTIQVNDQLIVDTTFQDKDIQNGAVYYYMYTVIGTDFKESNFSRAVSVTAINHIKESSKIPGNFVLKQNFPNPFNPVTTIKYGVPENSWVTIEIFNLLGQRVAVLLNKRQRPGYYKIQWNAENLPSGIYWCRMKAEEFVSTIKLILLK